MPRTEPEPRRAAGAVLLVVVLVLSWLLPTAVTISWLGPARAIPLTIGYGLAAAITWWLGRRVRSDLVEVASRHFMALEPARDGHANVGPEASTLPFPERSLTGSGVYDSPVCLDGESLDGPMSGVHSMTDMVSRLEPARFRWILSSPAEQQFLGWSLFELQSKSFLDLVEEKDRRQAEEALRLATTHGDFHGLMVRIRTARGERKVIEVHASARYSADQQQVTYVRCLLKDVTERQRAERERHLRNRELDRVNAQLRQINHELSELKDRYSDLYEEAPAMYFSLDARGRLVGCNRTFLATLDRRREDLIGLGFEAFLDPSDVDRCRAEFAKLLETGSVETEARWRKAGGEPIDVWVSGTVLRGSRGDVEQTRCVAQDLTAKHRLEAEVRETNRSLERANEELSAKNRELDEFVYAISHDLQEPVRTLIGFADILLQDEGPRLNPAAREHLQRLSSASLRMRAMIQGLLNLSRAGRVIDDPAPVELTELIEVVRADLGELIRTRGAEVVVQGAGGRLWGDRRRLQQLLTNLVGNAIKYNQSPVPRVEIGLDGGCEGAGQHASATLTVRDNGIGIEPKHQQKIFLLFRRLHRAEDYPGTGVGLALCKKIAQAHGGDIRVESRPGEGSTFFISLPSRPAANANALAGLTTSAAGPRIPASGP